MTEDIENINNFDIHQYCNNLILKHNIDLGQRCINITGDIEEATYVKLDKHLKILEVKDDEITIYINSYGGCLLTQFAIIDRIRSSSCAVHTIGTGVIMSAAIGILAAGAKRSATRHCFFMTHGLRGNSPTLTVPEQENDLKFSKMLEQKRFKFLAETTNKPYSWWSSTGKHVDYYFDADEALEIGLIDEII